MDSPHGETDRVSRFDGSQVLFRLAKENAIRARTRGDQADQEAAEGRLGQGSEPRARELDAVIGTITNAQAAAESYANWVHLTAGTTPDRGWNSWIIEWERLPEAAAALDRPTDFALSPEEKELLHEAAAWRNFLMHADRAARERLRARLINDGTLSAAASDADIVALLRADLAERLIDNFEALFRRAQRGTGINAPFTTGTWPGEAL